MTKKTEGKSKTDTIKERSLYVYLPHEEMTKEWKHRAEQAGTSISKFIIEHVTNSLNSEKHQPSVETRVNLIKSNKELQAENNDLHKKLQLLENLCGRLEHDLRKQTLQPFQQKDFTGIRAYEADLIKVFKTYNDIRKEDIYSKLDIDPMDKESTTAILHQIEQLERYGLIKDIGRKWRWIK